MKIKLQDITIDADMQSRDSVDEAIVNQYAECMQEGSKFPPVTIHTDGETNWLTDGFKRYYASLKNGYEDIEVVIHKGSRRDAEKFSWGVNDKHGQPRSLATKRLIVMKVLDDPEYADQLDREIARVTNLSHTFIANMRKELKKPHPVKTEKPVKLNTVVEAPLEEDHVLKELADLNKELHEENQKYRDQEMVLTGDKATTFSEIEDLRKQINILEMELTAVKNTRDQLQSKNAELIKSVNYWKKKYEKIAS
jgi:hypothetical protein